MRDIPPDRLDLSALIVEKALTAKLASDEPLVLPPGAGPFMAALKDWLIETDDPRWTGTIITALPSACADFCHVLMTRHPDYVPSDDD